MLPTLTIVVQTQTAPALQRIFSTVCRGTHDCSNRCELPELVRLLSQVVGDVGNFSGRQCNFTRGWAHLLFLFHDGATAHSPACYLSTLDLLS